VADPLAFGSFRPYVRSREDGHKGVTKILVFSMHCYPIR
jgi:hypothetical protein